MCERVTVRERESEKKKEEKEKTVGKKKMGRM